MSDETSQKSCFVDSNVWLYILLPGQDTAKANMAKQLVREKEANIVVSTQVVNEVINGVIKHAVMNEAEICELISRFYARYTVHQLTEAIQLNASRLRDDYSLSHWDSLIVSTALAGNAKILYSEDMHDGLIIDKQLTIVNPFASR